MVIQPPSSDLNVRSAGRAFAPSRVDADKIKSAMGVVVEVLESLLKLLSDTRTARALKEEGNGKARGPTQADIERIIQTSQEALAALRGRERKTISPRLSAQFRHVIRWLEAVPV